MSCRRGYSEKKLQENLQCEIMQVLAQEALEAYRSVIVLPMRQAPSHSAATPCDGIHGCYLLCRQDIVQLLPSNTIAELESNAERTVQWVQAYMQQHSLS